MIESDISIFNWRYVVPVIIAIVPCVLATDLINQRSMYRYCLALSIPWACLGGVLIYVGFTGYSMPTMAIFAAPFVFLICLEVLVRSFVWYKGEIPSITSASSAIGAPPLNGWFSRYPKNKRVTGSDYVFTLAHALIPIAILGAFAYWAASDIRRVRIMSHNGYYPAVWFAPINDPNKPDWEILPQEAKPGEVILSKRNELGILSNFAATPFEMDGERFASVEGFWQAMLYPEPSCPDCDVDPRLRSKKVTWKYTRDQVEQMTGFEAKEAGTLAEENMKTLDIDWCTYPSSNYGKPFPYRSATPGEHYRLIVAAMRAKLDQNPEVKRVLLSTGDLILKPDHHEEENAPPEWHYYEIWMEIRSELQRRN